MFCGVAGWSGVAVVQASRGAPVEKERAGPAQEATSDTTATNRTLMFAVYNSTANSQPLPLLYSPSKLRNKLLTLFIVKCITSMQNVLILQYTSDESLGVRHNDTDTINLASSYFHGHCY